MTIQYYAFMFICEGIDRNGSYVEFEQEFIHQTEEEARRELVHTLNHLYNFYPRKLKLKQIHEWEPSPFFFD